MEKISLTIDQWLEIKKSLEGNSRIPVWFHVTGSSMLPFIRPYRDDVMIVAVVEKELKIGDIVLFPGTFAGGNYCLHRIYQIKDNYVQTFGDGNRKPDFWQPKSQIIGKAVQIKRGQITIDCESPKWVRLFKLWNSFLPFRSLLLLPFRVMEKLYRMKNL